MGPICIKPRLAAASLATCVVFSTTCHLNASDWPRWRGPQQNGHSTEGSLPVQWSSDSVTWKVAVKGKGQSSPVIVGNRIFLTSALRDGEERVVVCLNRNTGKELWSTSVWTGNPEPTHQMNGWASSTCVADGERVFAFFGAAGGLVCLSHSGELLWQQDLGALVNAWGSAACPVLVGDLVIQNCDAEQDGFLIALNKVTGQLVWKTARPDARGWSTPVLIHYEGRDELVLNGDSALKAYDPGTGRELWTVRSFTGRGSPTVIYTNGLLHAVCGKRGDTYAVRPGGSGDVTDTHMVWHSPRRTSRDLPSPIAIDQQTLVMDMRRGVLTAYDMKTGRQDWQERTAETAVVGNFCASPVSWNGLAFFVAENGTTVVVKPGETMEIVTRNQVAAGKDEIFRSSLAASNGHVFLRSTTHLYCIGPTK
ncbi:MAG: PQQ-binding-like beta-propeller repeat protein [Planctomycetaceae bacterium]|nr:PQQ-binding-like beta-propeller repeat protein [Planctomycetaceae bacterium]